MKLRLEGDIAWLTAVMMGHDIERLGGQLAQMRAIVASNATPGMRCEIDDAIAAAQATVEGWRSDRPRLLAALQSLRSTLRKLDNAEGAAVRRACDAADDHHLTPFALLQEIWELVLRVWLHNWDGLPLALRNRPSLTVLKSTIDAAWENVGRHFALMSVFEMQTALFVAIDRAQRQENFCLGDLTHGWAANNGEA